MGIWDNAFKLPAARVVSGEEKKTLELIADRINKRALGHMAALVLESTRPVHNLGSQGMVFLSPVLNMIFVAAEVEKIAGLLENPEAISYLVKKLD